ncbi:MAG: aminopeptidase, partial [Clostridia bacterium]|nr:aminopeptidase [Clostridia bacterium]
ESIFSIDDGMKRLGEIALVDYSSPIRQSGVLFYETLFDENASCHFALGKSFSSCYKNGNNTSEEELLKVGLNKSDSHVDFMVGTKDLSIVATTFSGEKIEIFKNGKWTF